MSKRKYDWCYFADGSKKKITNWYQSGEDILFFINDKLYLYKQDGFEYEELFAAISKDIVCCIVPKSRFYIHRYSSDCVDKDNEDEWAVICIEKIELRK